MKEALAYLQEQKAALKVEIGRLERRGTGELTQEMIAAFLEKHRRDILAGDPQACKRVLAAYVDKVVVHEDHVDLFLKVVVDFNGGGGGNRTPVRKSTPRGIYQDSPGFGSRSSAPPRDRMRLGQPA